MDKLTYLAELAEGLARWVPERERQDILRYYAEYFEEAGPEREADVVRELGDPWALSCRLAVEGGYVTQEQARNWAPPRRKKWPWLAAAGITAAVLVFTVISVAMGAAAFGRIVGRSVAETVTKVADVAQAEPARPSAVLEPPRPSLEVVEDYGFVPVESQPPVAYVEGHDGALGFWSMEDGCLDAFEDIDVNISLGNITIHTAEDYSLAIQKEGDLGDYKLKWTVEDGRLKVEDARPGGFQSNWVGVTVNGWNGGTSRRVDVIITVPDAAGLQKLEAKTDVGNILLGSLEVAKSLEAKTDVGNVEGYGLRTAKKITLKSDVGDVTVGMEEPRRGTELELKANVGDVEANLDCLERNVSYELACGVGTVCVNGVDQGDRSERENDGVFHLDAKSDVGDVNVFFQDDRW